MVQHCARGLVVVVDAMMMEIAAVTVGFASTNEAADEMSVVVAVAHVVVVVVVVVAAADANEAADGRRTLQQYFGLVNGDDECHW